MSRRSRKKPKFRSGMVVGVRTGDFVNFVKLKGKPRIVVLTDEDFDAGEYQYEDERYKIYSESELRPLTASERRVR